MERSRAARSRGASRRQCQAGHLWSLELAQWASESIGTAQSHGHRLPVFPVAIEIRVPGLEHPSADRWTPKSSRSYDRGSAHENEDPLSLASETFS